MESRCAIRAPLAGLFMAMLWGLCPAGEALALAAGPAGGNNVLLLHWSLFLLGVIAIVFIFYKPVYGMLLKYYHPDYCKQVVWSLMLLYLLGWIAIGAFVLFEYGFMFFWLKWVFVFLAGLWVIWFCVVLFRKNDA